VRVTVGRRGTILGSATAPVNATTGEWTARVRVKSSAAAGPATVEAFCIFSPQAEGAYEAYAPVAITITRPASSSTRAASSRELPRTGTGTAPLTGAALGLIGGGLLLVAAATPQPRRAPDRRPTA
jgi:hypothetical protein